MIAANGCWAEYRVAPDRAAGRPCLFLDRDGVIIEDTGYPHDAGAVVLIPEALDLVGAANRAGYVTGIVSNQSGIGRGYFGWDAFAAVQRTIDAALTSRDGRLDFVLACPHIRDALRPEHRVEHHPWRKPAPGMLLAAAEGLGLDLGRSVMVGDRDTDMMAAANAFVAHRVLLGGPFGSSSNGASPGVSRSDLRTWFASISGTVTGSKEGALSRSTKNAR